MEMKLNQLKINFNIMINIINQKINNFIQRNNEQLFLIEKIINCYKYALNSNNLTYQILFNIKNFMNINNIDLSFLLRNTPIDLSFNFLNSFSIDNIIKDNFNLEKIQKNSEIKYGGQIESLLLLDNKNKIIINTCNKISLVNLKDFSYDHSLSFKDNIISLNLMKTNEDIFISFENNSIGLIKIINNNFKVEYILNNIPISHPGIIVDYKTTIAWTNGEYLCFDLYPKFNLFECIDEKLREYDYDCHHQSIYLKYLFQHSYDNILFIYIFSYYDHHEDKYSSAYFGLYNENKKYYKDCISLEGDYSNSNDKYKIIGFKSNQVIVFGAQYIFVIDVFNWKNIQKIKIENNLMIHNAFNMENNYFIIFLEGNNQEEDINENSNNKLGDYIFIIKINENIQNIQYIGDNEYENDIDINKCTLLKIKYLRKENEKICNYRIGLKKNKNHQIITLENSSKMNIYELSLNNDKKLLIKNN